MTSGLPSVVDFFSGCGGTSQGFRDAGLRIAAGLDSDLDSAETFRGNFPEAAFIHEDIRLVTVDRVASLLPGGPLLFAGCAPCQPFSAQNQRQNIADPRRSLLQEFSRFVTELLPEFVVIENVPGMQRRSGSGPLDAFIESLTLAGYATNADVLRSLEFGVPQTRRRLVLVAALGGEPQLPAPTHGDALQGPTTVRSAIEGLPSLSLIHI